MNIKRILITSVLSILFIGVILSGFADIYPGANCYSTIANGGSLDMSACTSGFQIPTGSTANRPSPTAMGMMRMNSDTGAVEMGLDSSNWAIFYTSKVFNNAPSHAIQTVAASGNGWQISSGRDSQISYSVLINVTASISSGQSGYVVLEICPTNSSTAANWLEVARTSSSQVYTLAIALQGVQGAGASLTALVPAGYYTRLRSVNVTGTPTYSFVSGQEVQL